jgi:hypothetical protein
VERVGRAGRDGLTPLEWSTPLSASAEEEEDHRMPRRKKHAPEEIVAKLRQVEVLTGQGTPVSDAIRAIAVTEASSGTSCSRWRSSTHWGVEPRSGSTRS